MQTINNNINSTDNSTLQGLSPSSSSNYLFYVKIFYLFIIASITSIFGLLPLYFNNFRKDTRLLSYANAFSGGIFLGIGFFHLLPEANENFELYFSSSEGKSSFIYGWPISYLLAFLSYSFILYLEKVVFNSHSLMAHIHIHKIEGLEKNNLKEHFLANNENNNNEINSNMNNNEDEEIGQDEQIIKNAVSSKRKFSSSLQSRNLSKSVN